MRNLSHTTTQQFLKRLGHQTRKSPPVGGTWEEYDRLRKQSIPHALTPAFNNLKTVASILGLWREKTKSSVPGKPATWGSPSAPGIVNKMRVTDKRKRKRMRPYLGRHKWMSEENGRFVLWRQRKCWHPWHAAHVQGIGQVLGYTDTRSCEWREVKGRSELRDCETHRNYCYTIWWCS